MDWLRRFGHPAPTAVPAAAEPTPQPRALERVAPALAVFFEGVSEDRSHSVLDLGAAAHSSLQVYSRFARWIRFADLVSAASSSTWPTALAELPPHPERAYDLLFAWDVLDRLRPDQRPELISRLVDLSAPDARLFIVSASSDETIGHDLRFTLLDVDRIGYAETGAPRSSEAPLHPGQVESLLSPFEVKRAFSSQIGLREYVAARRPRSGGR